MARTGGLAALAVVIVLALGVAPAPAAASIAVTDANFGNVLLGTTSTLTVTVSDPEAANLEVDGFSITGAGSSQFSVTTDNCAPYPRTFSGTHNSCTYEVTFQPSSRGSKSANLVVASTAASGDNTASLAGVAVAPVVGVPASVPFGEAQLGTTGVTQNVVISNTTSDAGQALYVTSANSDAGDYTIDGGNCTPFPKAVQPGSSCLLTVRFVPAAAGTRNATLQVSTNDPVNPTKNVSLSGTGTDEALTFAPTGLAFADQFVGTTSAAKTLTLTNSGTVGDLVLNSVAVAGVDAADFSVESNSCAPPKALGPGESCALGIRFAPSAAAARSAGVHVVSNVGEGNASLAGTGTTPPPTTETGPPTTDTGASPTPDAGGSTPSTTTAPLVDSSTPTVSCVVPKLKGKTLTAAKLALRRAHCRLGKVTRARASGRPGRVLRQSIRAGSRRPEGTRVGLVLARGK